jgi:DNA-binding response OmpR family regulator
MPSVLAIVPGLPAALQGRHPAGDRLTIEVRSDPAPALQNAPTQAYDLLVLCGPSVDEQQALATQFQQHRRWRLVPVLYVVDEGSTGIAIPGSFRPEMDGLVRGAFDSIQVQRRIKGLAREGTAEAELLVAGPFELDPVHGRLRLREVEVSLTDREAEILAILLARPNRTVTATEIIERGWGAEPDSRHLQILRRHVSNIRQKLEHTPAARSVRTVRGFGYRFDIRLAS